MDDKSGRQLDSEERSQEASEGILGGELEQEEERREEDQEQAPQPEERESVDDIKHSEIDQFLKWLKDQFGKDPRTDIKTDLLIEQFLLWSGPDDPEQQEVRRNLEKYFGDKARDDEGFLDRIKRLIGSAYRLAPDTSFPWQTTMTRLLDERVSELQNVEYDAKHRLERFRQALENGDEFTCQVILLSLAKTSDFQQEWLEEYYKEFGTKNEKMENPDTKKRQFEYVPNSRQLWFENKLRRTAKQAGVFNVWQGYRFELNDKKESVLRPKEEVAKGADFDAEQIGGRRGQLAGEPFSYNTYRTQEEVDATNSFLRKKVGLLDKEIEEYEQEIKEYEQELDRIKRAIQGFEQEGYKIEKTKEIEGLQRKREELRKKIKEHQRQRVLIEEILRAGGYRVGDLKTMLLDPMAELEIEKGELKYPLKHQERHLAMDLGLTKFLTGKLSTDVQITLRGEHANPLDIASFVQMFSLRRIQEFEWACKHSFFGARVSVTGEYDDKRNTYKNSIVRMLDDGRAGEEARDFTRMALGFYVQKGKIRAKDAKTGKIVWLCDYNDEIRRTIEEKGYFDEEVPFENREEDLQDRIKKAVENGQFVEEEAGEGVEENPGKLTRIIRNSDGEEAAISRILRDVEAGEIEIGRLEEELGNPAESKWGQARLDLVREISNLADDVFDNFNEQEDKRFDPKEAGVRDFLNKRLETLLRKFAEELDAHKSPPIPRIERKELDEKKELQEWLESTPKDAVERRLAKLNEELEKSCKALALERQLQDKMLPYFEAVRQERADERGADIKSIEGRLKDTELSKTERDNLFEQLRSERTTLKRKLEEIRSFRQRLKDEFTDVNFQQPLNLEGEVKEIFDKVFAKVKMDDKSRGVEVITGLHIFMLVYNSLIQKIDEITGEETTEGETNRDRDEES
jgi:hypothetical protein